MTARKAVFVTGAASGIGLATAERFAQAGWLVGVADLNASAAETAAQSLPHALALALDVRDRAQWAAALSQFAARFGGRLDALVNNAGVARYGWFEDLSGNEMDLIVDVNLKGVLNGAYASLDLLKATPGARLINVGSCAGLVGAPRQAAYSATKWAVRGLSDALGVEFSRFGVGVACIMPWFVETPILDSHAAGSNESFRDAIRQTGATVCTVHEAAEAIWRAANGEATAIIVGRQGRQLRFMARYFPALLRKRLLAAIA